MATDDPDLGLLARYFIGRVGSAEDVQAFFRAFPGASDPAIEAHFHEIVREAQSMDEADGGRRTRSVCDKVRLFRLCRLIGADRALSEPVQRTIALFAEWIDSSSWEKSQAFLQRNPSLLTDAGREILHAMAEMQLSPSEATEVVEHLDLLDQCRAIGVVPTFQTKLRALNAEREATLAGLIRTLVNSPSAAQWLDHLSRHPVLMGANGSETRLGGLENAPDKISQIVQQTLRSLAEDPQLPPARRRKVAAMQDFLRQASFDGDRLTYPRSHLLLSLLDTGHLAEFAVGREERSAPSAPATAAGAATNPPNPIPGRAAYFAARERRAAPMGIPAADFMGLRDCRRLRSAGRSRLYVGRNAQGALMVAKFYPAAVGDGLSAYERDEARLMYVTNYGPMRWCVLPIEGHVNQVVPPDDASSIGWACTTPWCALGSLRDRLEFGPLDTHERVLLMLNMAICLRGLHGAHIVHGDVKPDNFLFWEPGEAEANQGHDGHEGPVAYAHLVLSDLGSSAHLRNPALRRGRSGTPGYQAPESLRGAESAYSDDVWAWAAVATELFTGAPTLPDGGAAAQALQTAGCPAWLSSLIQACQAGDPAARPSFANIVGAFAEHCSVGIGATSGSVPSINDFTFRLEDLPGETIKHCPELMAANKTPFYTVVSSDGISDTLRTVAALLRDNRHESFVEGFRIMHKRFACDGGRGSLMWQLRADPDAVGHANPPTRPLGPKEVMGQRLPIPRSDAYLALDLYLNAIVLVRQHCLDSQAEDEGRRVVEFFGFDRPGCAIADKLVPATMLSLMMLFGSAEGMSHYVDAVIAQLRDDDPGIAGGAAGVLTHCLLANGNIADAIRVATMAANAQQQTSPEEACRSATTAAVLCALDDNVELLGQLFAALTDTSVLNTVMSFDLWQLSTRYLDSGMLQRADPLMPMRDLLLGGTFFVKGVSVARLWLGCACLWRMGEHEMVARLAGVIAQDPRLALPFNEPFARALRHLS